MGGITHKNKITSGLLLYLFPHNNTQIVLALMSVMDGKAKLSSEISTENVRLKSRGQEAVASMSL